MKEFTRSCGVALGLGGVLLISINVFLTPFMPAQEDEAVLRTSAVYLARLSASVVAAILLLVGCLGVHLAQRKASGAFGRVAFVVAFVGTCLLIGVEWANLFVLPAVARSSPEALEVLGESKLMMTGFASAAGLFALGWILLAVSLLRSGMFARWAPVSVLAGLVLIPALGATPLGVAGAIAGNVVLGLGFVGLGRVLVKAD